MSLWRMHRDQLFTVFGKAIPWTNNWITLTLAVMASVLLIAPPTLGQDPRKGTNQGGKSPTGHLYLFIGGTDDSDMPTVGPGYEIIPITANQGVKFAFNRLGLFQAWNEAWIDGAGSNSGTTLYRTDSPVADEFGNAYVRGGMDPLLCTWNEVHLQTIPFAKL